MKIEGSSAEIWTGDHGQEVVPKEQQTDNPTVTDSPERKPQVRDKRTNMCCAGIASKPSHVQKLFF